MELKSIPKAIFELKNLELVNLKYNNFPENEQKMLRKKLPKTEIFF